MTDGSEAMEAGRVQAQGQSQGGGPKWRVGIAGIAIEASTFSPHVSSLEDFTVRQGPELLGSYPWVDSGRPQGKENSTKTWCGNVEWVPAFTARALPGGPVAAADYATLRSSCLRALREAGPLDGLLLDLHGAMSVVGMQDAETDLVRAIRDVVGPETLLSASMDLHGNMSRELALHLDLATCYRMAPHEDAAETKERAARNLVRRLRQGGRPMKAWVQVPVLLPGERTSTRDEPARGLYGSLPDIEARPGILDAAIWVGYAWGDEPRSQAAVVVTGDDAAAIMSAAHELAQAYWTSRRSFRFVAPTGTFEECIGAALTSDARPFVISDSGDNPTAGGAGDVTYGLAQLLGTGPVRSGQVTVVYASILDPAAVRAAVIAGPDAPITLEVGGKVDQSHPPQKVTGTVRKLALGHPDGGDLAAVQVGGLSFILTSRRMQFHRVASWTAVGLDPSEADIVVVKLGYLEPEIYELAADWRLALTPGGVDQDLLRLPYRQVRRPIFPLDPQMADPDLEPEQL